MAHSIQRATTGRAKCRACKQTIVKDSYRLGEEVPNAFGEGTSTHWYHLSCGARQRAEAFLFAWRALKEQPEFAELVADSDGLEASAELGLTYYRLQRFVRVERASSGRARCQGCRELIEKGVLRFALQRIEDGVVGGAGFVHVGCAHAYAGAVDEIVDRIAPLSSIDESDWSEVRAELSKQEQLPRTIKVPFKDSAQTDVDPEPDVVERPEA